MQELKNTFTIAYWMHNYSPGDCFNGDLRYLPCYYCSSLMLRNAVTTEKTEEGRRHRGL